MSSPVSITVKALVTVAMLGVTGSLMRQNSQIKSNIAVTQSNIQTLKNEHKQKLAKPKRVNFTSAYQKAEATGNKLVPVITQYANTSLDQMKNSENSSQLTSSLNKYSSEDGMSGGLAMYVPFGLQGASVSFVHGSMNKDNEVRCAWLIYDGNHQLQAVVNANYDSMNNTFSDYSRQMSSGVNNLLKTYNGMVNRGDAGTDAGGDGN